MREAKHVQPILVIETAHSLAFAQRSFFLTKAAEITERRISVLSVASCSSCALPLLLLLRSKYTSYC